MIDSEDYSRQNDGLLFGCDNLLYHDDMKYSHAHFLQHRLPCETLKGKDLARFGRIATVVRKIALIEATPPDSQLPSLSNAATSLPHERLSVEWTGW